MSPLIFSSPPVDAWHRDVLLKIRDDKETLLAGVSGPGNETFEGVIKGKASATKSVHFDIVGHSKDGVQTLCDWLVNDGPIARNITARWQQATPAPRLGNVRFLGCNTAVTTAGIAALARLSKLWGVPIVGTTTPIDDGDFTEDGFNPRQLKTKVIAESDLPEGDSDARRMGWFRGRQRAASGSMEFSVLRSETVSEIAHDVQRYPRRFRWKIGSIRQRQIERILSLALDVPRLSPGLLALPDYELVWPARTSALGLSRFHRMTVLLGGAYVRLYPRGSSAGVLSCLPTQSDSLLKSLAATAPDFSLE